MSSKAKKLGDFAHLYQREHLDGSITKIKLHQIHPSKNQPRQNRKDEIDELAQSIQKDGLLSPIVVTKEDKDRYRIIAGERRFHAVSSLGWKDVECKIISRDKLDYWRIAIIENLMRKNLSAQEEAAALLQLKKDGDLSDAEIAKTTGKSRNYITEILSINSLPPKQIAECESAGITNKNILIQAAQAYKKGLFSQFLKEYAEGKIQTVKQAKAFNQGRPKGEGASPKKQDKPAPAAKDPLSAVIRQTGAILTIQCETEDAAKALAAKIQGMIKQT